jgi:chitin disaccharide deacetylase
MAVRLRSTLVGGAASSVAGPCSERQGVLSRRRFLQFSVPAVGAALAARTLPAWAASGAPPAPPPRGQRYLIVNADDLGMTTGINRGVIDAHVHGVLTSASLMVTSQPAEEAVQLARGYPELSVGLHVDLTSGPAASIPLTDLDGLSAEVERQMTLFRRLTGVLPTHIDSHHHVHRRFNVARAFLDVSERYGLPLRGFSPVVYLGGFYGQWPEGESNPARISAQALAGLAANIGPGLTEIGCHPGYFEPGLGDVYGREREIELHSLTDPSVRRAIGEGGISLISYRDNARLTSAARGPRR